MTKYLMILTTLTVLAGCEPNRGAGFTGIGPAPSQSLDRAYDLTFDRLTSQN